MGQYKNIPISIGMVQETLDDAMGSPDADQRFEEIYMRLQLSIDKKREFYKDTIEETVKGS
jgi:hypothetical protein